MQFSEKTLQARSCLTADSERRSHFLKVQNAALKYAKRTALITRVTQYS